MSNEEPCPICGGTIYTWGGIQTRRESGQLPTELQFFVYTKPTIVKILVGNVAQNRERLIARKCDACGRVDLFTRKNPKKDSQ
jgi:hypothetical protein